MKRTSPVRFTLAHEGIARSVSQWLWLVVFFALTGHGLAETPPNPNDEFAVQAWTTEDGLPQSTVTSLLQTRDGYIWAGTYSGIAQFDGESFHLFDSSHTAGLTNSRVTSMFEDAAGTIWIGHETSDLTRYSNGKFEPVPIHAAWKGGMISGIQADKAGDVWAIDLRGDALRIRDGLLVPPPPELAENPSLVPQLAVDNEGRLLMARNGYVAEITPSGCAKLDFHNQEIRPYYSCITAGRKGGSWIIGEGRVHRWAKQSWQEDLGTFPWENSYAVTMLEMSSGQLLVGTLERGLYIHDPALGWMNLSRTNGLPQDWVRCLMEDREHNIWLGTSGGLVILRPRSVAMRNPPDGWQGRPVQAIAQAKDGTIWAATEGAGLYRMMSNSWENFGLNAGLSNLFAWSVLEDSRNRVWAGTWGGGMYQFERTNFVRKFDMAERGEPVIALMEHPAGTLWIGTGTGLIRCTDDKILRYSFLGGAAAGDVRVLEPGKAADEIWVGTQGRGLGHLVNGQLQTFHRSDGLPSDFILSLYQETDGKLWIGTLDKGICLYENGKFYAITTEGLPNASIGHIEDDGLGYLWFSSQRGLFRAEKSELVSCAREKKPQLVVLPFGKAEGLTTLAGTGGFTPSGFRSADGRLWFPTARGIAVVNPRSVRRNSVAPPVRIEEILADGQQLAIRNETNAHSGGNVPAKFVKLQPGQRQLEVLFAGLSFTSPEGVQFKYKLENLDENWTIGGTRRRVTYPFLPPGNYTFRVIACNSDGLWNDAGDSVGLVVLPYFWQTLLFKTTSACAGLALVGGTVYLESRRRHRRKLDRIARERELERERARIAQDIHDDLGASLTRISMLSESATGDLDDRARAARSLSQIYSTARDLTRAMDEIVWAVNPRHDTLESLTNYIARFAHDFLSAANIRCRLDVPIGVPDLVVRSEIRHNLFLAFKEALNNAVKHSGASEVRVSIQFEPDKITLIVADNGLGFDVNNPPSRVNNRPAGGHGIIGIRSRLEQVGGRMEMESKKDQGTKVVFTLSMRDMAQSFNGKS
jgi:signal transduction histidine kinase/ligand-binding sensor domain-containing protein